MVRKHELAGIEPGTGTPLEAAVAKRDASVLDMVAAAVQHHEVAIAYQPIVQACAPETVAFYESFLRVLDSTGRVIPARDFMPLVEADELGRELDCASLRRAIRTLTKFPDLRLSVNMSARSIGYRKWMRILEKMLKENPEVGDRLILEMSEKSVMTVPELVTNFMSNMQARGVTFALDDFGSDTISLRHFRQFMFDVVKIDGQFIRGVAGNPANQSVVRALTQVAHEFGMFTVAESVESEADARFLISNGVDCLQGYFFGAPAIDPPWVPAEEERARA